MMRQCLSELCGAAQIRPPGLASRRILRERGEGSEGSEGSEGREGRDVKSEQDRPVLGLGL